METKETNQLTEALAQIQKQLEAMQKQQTENLAGITQLISQLTHEAPSQSTQPSDDEEKSSDIDDYSFMQDEDETSTIASLESWNEDDTFNMLTLLGTGLAGYTLYRMLKN